MKRIKLFVLATLVLVSSLGVTYGIIFYQVGNKPMFSYWNVAGDDPGDPIILHKNRDKEMYIAADAPFDITEFHVEATVVFSGIQLTYPLPDECYYIIYNELPILMGDEIQCRLYLSTPPYPASGDGMLVLTFYGQNNSVIASGATKFTIL